MYAVQNQLGVRCITDLAQYRTVIGGAADFDITGISTECPAAAPNQRRFTTRSMNVYVLNQPGSPFSYCTFNQASRDCVLVRYAWG